MKYTISSLEWDSSYFQCKCGRVDISTELDVEDIKSIKENIEEYDFTTITNKKSFHKNNKLIGENLEAYLVDVNVRLTHELKSTDKKEIGENVQVNNLFSSNGTILKIAQESFLSSRFYNDPRIDNIKAGNIYLNWVKNSFNMDNKYFCVYNEGETIEGFILFSKDEYDMLVIELVAVSEQSRVKGIGSKLIGGLYNFALKNNFKKIFVGTQVENITAINFYVKNGFKVNGIKYIYHLWK